MNHRQIFGFDDYLLLGFSTILWLVGGARVLIMDTLDWSTSSPVSVALIHWMNKRKSSYKLKMEQTCGKNEDCTKRRTSEITFQDN